MTWTSDLLGINEVYDDGVIVEPERDAINLISGSGVTVTVADNPVTLRKDVTFATAIGIGSGGATTDVLQWNGTSWVATSNPSVLSISVGSPVPSAGALRVANGTVAVASRTTGGVQLDLIYANSSDAIIVGDADAASLTLANNNVIANQFIRFPSTAVNPKLAQDDDTGASATGDTLLAQAQNCTGSTSTGGILDLRSGTGTTAPGQVQVRAGSALRITLGGTAATDHIGLGANPSVNGALSIDLAATTPSGWGVLVQMATGSSAGLVVQNNGATNPQLLRCLDATLIGKMQSVGATRFYVGTESSHNLSFVTNNSIRMQVSADGSVTMCGLGDGLYGSGVGVLNIQPAGTAPTTSATDTTLLWNTGGQLNLQGHAGVRFTHNVTKIASFASLAGTRALAFDAAGPAAVSVFDPSSDVAPQPLSISAAGAFNTATTFIDGAALTLSGGLREPGSAGLTGPTRIQLEAATALELVEVATGRRVIALNTFANLTTTEMPASTGDGVVYLKNAATAPSTGAPASGGIAWAATGALRWKEPNGEVTQPTYRGISTGGTTKLLDRVADDLQTTNATVTNILTYTVPDNSVVQFEVHVAARNQTAAEQAAYHVQHAARRRSAGSAALVGTIVKDAFEEDATWDVTTTVSGNDFLVQVTGEAANTIDWHAWMDVYVWTP